MFSLLSTVKQYKVVSAKSCEAGKVTAGLWASSFGSRPCSEIGGLATPKMMGWMRPYGYISIDLFWSDNDADWPLLKLVGAKFGGMAETLQLTADGGSRRRLRSASTSTLVIPSTRRMHHAGSSSLPGDCCSSVECSSVLRHHCCSSAATSTRHCMFQSSCYSP